MMVPEPAPDPSCPGSGHPAGSGRAVAALRVAAIAPTPVQPRTPSSDERLRELVASMAVAGLVQPILVRPHPTLSLATVWERAGGRTATEDAAAMTAPAPPARSARAGDWKRRHCPVPGRSGDRSRSGRW